MHSDPVNSVAHEFWRTVFDAIPLPAFVVDPDVQILECNNAASQLLGPDPQRVLTRRGGEALHCIHAQPAGCGRSRHCTDCRIRGSVAQALAGGRTHRETHKAQVRCAQGTRTVDLLVSASPLPGTGAPRVLLILEDVSELLELRSLVPVCSKCRKLRDDEQFWHSLESYLRTHMHLKVTHGLCPTCFREQLDEAETLIKSAGRA